uniref:Uncharacterized protein n=1 Tax=Chlamydomonas euryale TaxID=1486919 RepID=A0A7R9Z5M8_9CHLO|mmetsp:Transcript_45551/g.135844  ORF Transcript_45551/g.135844 Transcript_45551/m.135844 type:complete len:303 (+) Transcript_45551:267-1175(+)
MAEEIKLPATGTTMPANMTKKNLAGETYSRITGRYTSKQMGTGTITRKGPVDVNATMLRDPGAQDLASDTGARRTLNTNIPDHGPKINNNSLRYQRKQDFQNAMVHDGGANYRPAVCAGNWVEDRMEKDYASGFHARELGFMKTYVSEQNASYRPPSKNYYNQVYNKQPLAKPPRQSSTRKVNDADGSYLYYAKSGFGDGHGQDHTLPSSRGGYWVGTAPVRMHETMAATAARRGSFEFQKRNSCYDVNAKLLEGHNKPLDLTDRHMARTIKHLNDGQRWASTWSTTSSTAFKDYSRNAVKA